MKRILATAAALATAATLSIAASGSAHALDGQCVNNVRQHSRVYWTVTPNGAAFEGTVVHLWQHTDTASVQWDNGSYSPSFPVDELTTCNPVL